LISHVLNGEIPISSAKKVFPQLWKNSGKSVKALVQELTPKLQDPAVPPDKGLDLISLFFAADQDQPAGSLHATSTATVSAANLWPISDDAEVDSIVEAVLKANPKQVADYRAGKQKAFNSLVGQVMKASGGKANPAQVNEILRRKLGS
jgi:Asp-tRNA(Asn)/Glu-tRNA(Gln) amidotransferase B subunit